MANSDEKNIIKQCDMDMSLAKRLEKHNKDDVLPFHMPGHKRKGYEHLQGVDKIDITEIDGFDNLHDASGIILQGENLASEVFGVKCSRFLVNGSTAGILAGIRSICKEGDTILVARNCHKSVFNALELARLKPVYVMPQCFDNFFGAVTPQSVQEAFDSNPNITAMVLTSPTYEGVISDIVSIADICHEHNAILFVDEAHGAHLSLVDFEKSARHLGADLVVNSLHKTLASLTQTAILHVCSDRIELPTLDKNLAMFQTSSPSYVLMASIDGCVRHILCNANEIKEWSDALDETRARLATFKKLKLFAPKTSEKAFAYDKSKLVILCDEADISGVELKKLLREKYNIELEMEGVNYAIAMSGMGDTKESFARLERALFEIDDMLERVEKKQPINIDIVAKKHFEPYQINTLSCEYVDFGKSVGMVSAENIWAYPPGCPIVVKGEEITSQALDCVKKMSDAGVSISSEMRKTPSEVMVIAERCV